MSPLERYRQLYEYEKDCNCKMLTMLESVPEANRADARFQQAVNLAAHLVACRENWLEHIIGGSLNIVDWFEKASDLATLPPRFAALEARWTDYLANLSDAQTEQDFEFLENGERFQLSTEVQIIQLVCHAPYHRGQIALLVDQLGGETVDTDYVYWILEPS